VNHGKGVALIEAFHHALAEHPFDVLVTLDGDGQHRPEEIAALVKRCRLDGTALVIGERHDASEMPLRSDLGNRLTKGLVQLRYAECPYDTQSGFRALRREFVQEVVRIVRGGRYETEMRMLLHALHRGLRIGSIPIPTVYLEGNRSSHFRPLIDSLRIGNVLLETSRLPPEKAPPREASGDPIRTAVSLEASREASRKVS